MYIQKEGSDLIFRLLFHLVPKNNYIQYKSSNRFSSSRLAVPIHLFTPLRTNYAHVRLYSTKNANQPKLTHTDPRTGEARMVSVTDKTPTKREAKAIGRIILPKHAYTLLKTNEVHTSKGNVLTVAQIAGIQAAKATSNLIPLCHPLLLGLIDVKLWLDDQRQSVECESTVQTSGKTGVEMEALTATSVALLTVYDMCKAASKEMTIEGIRVIKKTGGKSDLLENDIMKEFEGSTYP